MGFVEIMTDSTTMFCPPGGWNKAINNQEIVKAQNQYTWLTKVQNMSSKQATHLILTNLYKSRWPSNPIKTEI
jgi:hypothetical protein